MQKCDGRCQGANPWHRGKCQCPCGGRNHGKVQINPSRMEHMRIPRRPKHYVEAQLVMDFVEVW